MCPFFSLIISGKNAFNVWNWPIVLTENVLQDSISTFSVLQSKYLLLYIFWGEVKNCLSLHDTSIVD